MPKIELLSYERIPSRIKFHNAGCVKNNVYLFVFDDSFVVHTNMYETLVLIAEALSLSKLLQIRL